MIEKKKILWITASWSYDTDKDIVPYLMQSKIFEISWWVLIDSKSKVELSDCKGNIFFIGGRLRNINRIYEYIKFFKKSKFHEADIVYSDELAAPFYYPTLFFYAKKRNIIVHAAHNVIPYPVWSWWLKIYVKYIFKTNQHFQMFSKFTAEYFRKHYPHKSYFYCPMTLKGYGEVSTDNYEIDSSKLNLLFFGNVVLNKRLDLLIQAVKELPLEVKRKVHLTIAGKCNTPQQYLEQIGNDESITVYFKRIDDCEIAELFTKHDFLVLPYQDVAQSGPHMIAYYYNLPVIASDIEGFKERVVDNVNGILFKSKDKDDLKAKIIKAANMSDEEKAEMKANLKRFSEDNFSLKEVSRKYIEYFNSLIQ